MSLVLADTSVWVAHFRKPNQVLQTLLSVDQVLCHPMVLIEVACRTPPAQASENAWFSGETC
jgi:predicted nucleic acid-binding protein